MRRFEIGNTVYRVYRCPLDSWTVYGPAIVTTVLTRQKYTPGGFAPNVRRSYYLTYEDCVERRFEVPGCDLFASPKAAREAADGRHNRELREQMR